MKSLRVAFIFVSFFSWPIHPAHAQWVSYTLTSGSAIVCTDATYAQCPLGAFIPADPGNADYQKYQKWTAAGNTAAPYVAPPTPPQTYSFLQFMTLFTPAELTAIFTSNDTQTKMFITMAAGSGGMQLSNAQVIAGVNYLAAATTATPPGPGLITTVRAAQILAGTSP